jgi:hypothetical protein
MICKKTKLIERRLWVLLGELIRCNRCVLTSSVDKGSQVPKSSSPNPITIKDLETSNLGPST